MTILTYLLPAVPLLYAFMVIYFISLLLKKTTNVPINIATRKLPGISIVLPFRNEAGNLLKVIDSLDTQTYPGDFEIVLVNDGSTDHYHEAIGRRSPSRNRPLPLLRVIDSHYAPDRRLTSKQQALDYGIKEAKHEWIALTDADMVLSPVWLETLIEPVSKGPQLVFGHTSIISNGKKRLFTWFQSFQLETLFSFAQALHRAGIAGSCMGNNLLISKETFKNIGGFEAIGYSIVEDRDLLAAFCKKKIPVAATDPFFPTAFTMPCETVKAFMDQLLRWARGGFWKASKLSILGILLLAHTILFLIAATGQLPLGLSIFLMTNQLLTWLFVSISFRKNRSSNAPVLFPLFFAIFLVETIVVCIALIIKRRMLWKERKL